jgi:tRNA uridine 5-carboxymethylaminomethyl modification enzyme
LIANEITRLHVVRSGQFLLGDLLRRPEVSYDDLPVKNPELSEEIRRQVEIQVKYAGYIDRQEIEATRLKSLESKIIPPSFEYDRILGLRTEARQKLGIVRPTTIAQASRISGISPADIGLLLVHLKRQ